MSALDALQQGDVDAALEQLFDEVRAEPQEPRHRIFLFQLLAVAGQWDRALTQLNVVKELDPAAGVMAQAYHDFVACEAFRGEVFAGSRSPVIFGDPEPWLAQLIEALRLEGQGEAAAARDLRQEAFEAATAMAGSLELATAGEPAADGPAEQTPFEWLADGDSRLGPVLEMIVNGRYYWAPWSRIAEVVLEPPTDLRDLIWAPAHFRWSNEGEAVGVIPTRYVGSEADEDPAIRLARKTRWDPIGDDQFAGAGQRVFMTDQGEYDLLTIRRIAVNAHG